MAPEGTDAEVRALQAALAEVEEVFRLEQRGWEETNETLLRVQQERSSWQRVGELQRLLQQQAAVCAAEQQRLNELNEKVRELRERLAKQPQAHQVVEEAVAKVECDTQQRRHSQQLQWEAKQQEMDQKLEARLAFLEEQKAQCLKELLKWRRRMALLRIGRAGSSWKLQRRNELEQQQLDFQLLRLRKRLSRKQGHLDEEVALKAMGLKKELDKEAASNDLRQEERQEELEQLEEEVDALKERTAKAKELLRQHTQLNQAIGICPARSASQRIRRLSEACAISESQAAKHARRHDFEASTGRPSRLQGQLRGVEEDIQRSIRRSQSERRGLQIQAELRRFSQ